MKDLKVYYILMLAPAVDSMRRKVYLIKKILIFSKTVIQ